LKLKAAELALNRLIDKRELAALAGLVLKLQCQELCLFVLLDESGIALKTNWPGRIDCHLSAPLSAWLGLLAASDKAAPLQAPPFVCEGKAELPLQLLHLLRGDFAYPFSRLAGPLPAALLERTSQYSREFSEQLKSSLQHSLAEYLTAETALLPSRNQIEAAFAEIADLQQRLAVLEQRLA